MTYFPNANLYALLLLSSGQDVVSQSVVEVTDRKLYDLDNDRAVAPHGPLDMRMGVSSKSQACETCGALMKDCNGHYGQIRLVLPAFHVGYFTRVIGILQEICKVGDDCRLDKGVTGKGMRTNY